MSRSLRRESAAAGFLPTIDRGSPVPVVRQLYLSLRDAVLAGSLPLGVRLPSTRMASREWGLSRGVIADAYDMLIAEEYAAGRHGSGTYVVACLPQPSTRRDKVVDPVPVFSTRRVSAVVEEALRAPIIDSSGFPQTAFVTGRVVHDARTARLLARIASRHIDYGRDHYGDAQGEPDLRAAIAAHLAASRGVRCTAGQIFITSGTQQALDLVIRVLVTPGQAVVVEDPCYPPARQAMVLNGVRPIGLPVDTDGLVTDLLRRITDKPAAIYVTPSHQYPAGSALPLARRLQLLAFAQEAGCWIIEDDYDSEFRFEGRPITALQGLDDSDRVIYVGTFSKALLPGLRLGYLVAPPDLVQAFSAIRPMLDRFPATFQQRVIADFLNEGYFPAHLRRLRESYRASRNLLVELLHERLGEHLSVNTPAQGVHLTVGSTGTWRDDVALSRAARQRGVVVIPISPMHLSPAPDRLILGFSGLSDREADTGTRLLADTFASFTRAI